MLEFIDFFYLLLLHMDQDLRNLSLQSLQKWCLIDCSYESKDFNVIHREAACINAILLAAKEMSVGLLQDS